jgi:hypothetical protein
MSRIDATPVEIRSGAELFLGDTTSLEHSVSMLASAAGLFGCHHESVAFRPNQLHILRACIGGAYLSAPAQMIYPICCFAGRSLVVQAPTGSGKSAVLMCLPFLASVVSTAPAPAVTLQDESTRHPLVFLYCFPLETIRAQFYRYHSGRDDSIFATSC